jgi:hypothetical protein
MAEKIGDTASIAPRKQSLSEERTLAIHRKPNRAYNRALDGTDVRQSQGERIKVRLARPSEAVRRPADPDEGYEAVPKGRTLFSAIVAPPLVSFAAEANPRTPSLEGFAFRVPASDQASSYHSDAGRERPVGYVPELLPNRRDLRRRSRRYESPRRAPLGAPQRKRSP